MSSAGEEVMDVSTRNDWHVVTKSHGGVVSIIKNLDEKTARRIAADVNVFEQHRGDEGYISIDSGDIVQTWVLGPSEEDNQ